MTLHLVIFSQLLIFDDARSMTFELVISFSFFFSFFLYQEQCINQRLMDTSAIQRQTMNASSLDGLQVLRCVTVINNDVGRFCLYVLHNTAAMLSSLYFKFYDTRLKVYFIITREVFVA